jgi:hypothetical protein
MAPVFFKREDSQKNDDLEEDYAIHDKNAEYKLSIMKKKRTIV